MCLVRFRVLPEDVENTHFYKMWLQQREVFPVDDSVLDLWSSLFCHILSLDYMCSCRFVWCSRGRRKAANCYVVCAP